MNVAKFKTILVGATNVGKTSYIRKVMYNEFFDKHVPTMGVEVHPIAFKTNKGDVIFNVWDCAGDERFKGLGCGYYLGANCAIVLYDTENKETKEIAADYVREIRSVLGENIPIVAYGTKNYGDHCFPIKSDKIFYDPFEELLKLLVDKDCEITSYPKHFEVASVPSVGVVEQAGELVL